MVFTCPTYQQLRFFRQAHRKGKSIRMIIVFKYPQYFILVSQNKYLIHRIYNMGYFYLIFSMKLPKVDQLLDIKTGNSQQSDIDLFSKLEASFLQKFFKYNLSDYFSQIFSNLYQDAFDKKINSKLEKALAISLFVSNKTFSVGQFSIKIQNFYHSKSKSLSDGHLPFGFKKLYCNNPRDEQTIKKQQIILVDVKIKAEVMKIQEVPQKILKALSNFKAHKKENLGEVQKFLSQYRGQYFNIFYIYFGDVNFNIFNKKMYETQTIKLMGNTFKLRIFVFFVSKQALIETFKTINKIENLQYINDLVIQFYQLKREKQRRKRVKEEKKSSKIQQPREKFQVKSIALGVVGVVSLTVFGIAIKKIFF